MKIELHPEADAEFAAQVDYYEEKQHGSGRSFYREMIGCLDWIAENPTVPRLRKDHRRANLKVFPFHIACAVDSGLIWVLAVAHSHRRPGYWKIRLAGG